MFQTLRKNEGVWVTLIGSMINVFLVMVKLLAGTLGHSTAMIADAIHSLSDLLNDVVVIFSFQIGRIPKDEGHPYGHGRAETIGATIIGAAIVLVGFGMVSEVWRIIVSGTNKDPKLVTAFVAVVSIIVKETLYHYTKAIGEKLHSPIIIANAWDQRSDALSSGAAFIGIVLAMNGYPVMDTLAAGVVGLMILKVGYSVLKNSIHDLMDSALDETQIQKVESVIRASPGVIELHDLRTRKIGGKILIDVHVLVDSEISVTEGHNIAETVRRELIRSFDNVQDALVHIDPEDDSGLDQIYRTTREELKRRTDSVIAATNGLVNSGKMRVHYLNGKNLIEVFVCVEKKRTAEEVRTILTDLKSRLLKIEAVDDAHVYLDINHE